MNLIKKNLSKLILASFLVAFTWSLLPTWADASIRFDEGATAADYSINVDPLSTAAVADFTFAVWSRRTTVYNYDYDSCFFNFYDGGYPVRFCIFGDHDGTNKGKLYFCTASDSSSHLCNAFGNNISSTALIPSTDLTWHFLVLTLHRGTANATTVKFFVDGVLTDTFSGTDKFYWWGTNFNRFSIGRSNGNYADNIAAISVSYVGLWDRIITDGEITSLYNNGFGVDYTTGSYDPFIVNRCNEATGIYCKNAIPPGPDYGQLTLTATTSWQSDAPLDSTCGDPGACALCADETACTLNDCYWALGSCHEPCSWDNCSSCADEDFCRFNCGVSHWYSNVCNQIDNPSCEIGDLETQINDRGTCLLYGRYWTDPVETTGQHCYDVACSEPPLIPLGANECGGSTTSTIQFIYSDYTTDWEAPTALFAGIFENIGNIADPILCWFNKFLSFFNNASAILIGKETALAFATIGSNLHAFDDIFGSIPVAETMGILILAYIIKGFFELGHKVISIFKP